MKLLIPILLALLLIPSAEASLYGAGVGVDTKAFNQAMAERTGALNVIWCDMLAEVAITRNTGNRGACVARYKVKAEAVLDAFEIAISGQKAAGGLLLQARQEELAKFDEFSRRGFA